MSSVTTYKTVALSHIENISSDEAQLVDNENGFPASLDSKKYGRTHRTSKKEKRQNRRRSRTTENDKERCVAHNKRRCTDLICCPIEITARKKRARHKYDDRKAAKSAYSSDSEDELLRNREELKMALNIIEPSNRTVQSSTLSHKLSAIQNQQALNDGKKTTNKHRKRKVSRSPERGRQRSKSIERKSKRSRNEHERSKSRTKIASPITVYDNNDNDIRDDDDEAVSLEEQELRLIALKSAVLKKHEARKRRKLAISQLLESVIRPYSPTDSVVLVAEETGERSNDYIDSDNNNMDISPISSPGNQNQPMDMELASSNENSKSPIFIYEKPHTFSPYDQFIDWGAVAIPVPINPTYVEMNQAATLNQPFAMQPPFSMMCPIPAIIQPDFKENETNTSIDNEEELRAQLIEQMRNTANTNGTAELPDKSEAKMVPKENSSNVDSLEEDCLRSLLLSSKGKKPTKESTNDSNVPVLQPKPIKLREPVDQAKCDDMPKLALNLREALKRLKSNQQNKSSTIKHQNDSATGSGEPLQDCDQNEIQKTVVNNRLDQNKNELFNADAAPFIASASATEPVPKPEKICETVSDAVATAAENTSTATVPSQMVRKVLKVTVAKANVVEVKKVNENVVTKSVQPEPAKQTLEQSAGQVQRPMAVTKIKPKLAPKPKVAIIAKKPQSPTLPIVKPPIVVAATATTSTVLPNINKMESLRKTTASPIISTWTAKPVKKLIISLNADSSSDNDDMDYDSKSTQNAIKTTDDAQTNDTNNAFQHRLDQFLLSVRANTNAVQETKQPVMPSTTTAKAIPKPTEKNVNSTAQKIQVSVIHLFTIFNCSMFRFSNNFIINIRIDLYEFKN